MFSLMPFIWVTSTSASRRRRASITDRISSSGAEAPAVRPTTRRPVTQDGSTSDPSATRCDSTPISRPISTKRLELELFLAPTTRIRSLTPARSRTAVWRFWVA